MPKAKKKCRTMSITEYLDIDDKRAVSEIVSDAIHDDIIAKMGSGSMSWDIIVEVCEYK